MSEELNKRELSMKRSAEFYKCNKVKILCKLAEKIKCPFCNRDVSKGSLNTHKKSKLCEKYTQERVKIAGLMIPQQE